MLLILNLGERNSEMKGKDSNQPQLSFTGRAEGWEQEGRVSGNPDYVLCMN